MKTLLFIILTMFIMMPMANIASANTSAARNSNKQKNHAP